ncbi:MAG: hypothetical protein ACOYN2_03265 [Patescibacteria group bacterium]
MTACKDILKSLFAEDLEGWANNLKVKTSLIEKLVVGNGTIHLDTAKAMTETINQKTGLNKTVSDFFELSELKGYQAERVVTYGYGSGRPVSKDEWVSYFRYIFEKRIRGHAIGLVFGISIAFSLALLAYWYFVQYLPTR